MVATTAVFPAPFPASAGRTANASRALTVDTPFPASAGMNRRHRRAKGEGDVCLASERSIEWRAADISETSNPRPKAFSASRSDLVLRAQRRCFSLAIVDGPLHHLIKTNPFQSPKSATGGRNHHAPGRHSQHAEARGKARLIASRFQLGHAEAFANGQAPVGVDEAFAKGHAREGGVKPIGHGRTFEVVDQQPAARGEAKLAQNWGQVVGWDVMEHVVAEHIVSGNRGEVIDA